MKIEPRYIALLGDPEIVRYRVGLRYKVQELVIVSLFIRNFNCDFLLSMLPFLIIF